MEDGTLTSLKNRDRLCFISGVHDLPRYSQYLFHTSNSTNPHWIYLNNCLVQQTHIIKKMEKPVPSRCRSACTLIQQQTSLWTAIISSLNKIMFPQLNTFMLLQSIIPSLTCQVLSSFFPVHYATQLLHHCGITPGECHDNLIDFVQEWSIFK